MGERQCLGTWKTDSDTLTLLQLGNIVFGDYGNGSIMEGIYNPQTKVLSGKLIPYDQRNRSINKDVQQFQVTLFQGAFQGFLISNGETQDWSGNQISNELPLFKSPIYQAPPTFTLSGKVLDKDGNGFGGATVLANDLGGTPWITTTKNDGTWTMATPLKTAVVGVQTHVENCSCIADKSKNGQGIRAAGKSFTLNPVRSTMGLDFRVGCYTPPPNIETAFTLNPKNPKLVVLIHGITAAPNKGNWINTTHHPQFYWGHDFIRTLLDPDGSRTFGEFIPPKAYPYNYNQSKLPYSKKMWSTPKRERTPDDQKDRLAEIYTSGRMSDQSMPLIGVMPLFRDASQSLHNQLVATIDQLYDSYQHYYEGKDKQANLYLVCHSFGGIVARALISNTNNKINGKILSDTHRKKADFLRNRIVWVSTLATPHEGSNGLLQKDDFAKNVLSLANTMEQEMSSKIQVKDQVTDLIKELEIPNYIDIARDAIVGPLKSAAEDLENGYTAPVYNDLRQLSPPNHYNKAFLHPRNGKRTDGTLIPIYTMTGRNPGANFYLNKRVKYDPLSIINSSNEIDKHYGEADDEKIAAEAEKALLAEMLAKSYFNPTQSIWGKSEIPEGDLFSVATFKNSSPYSYHFLDRILKKGIYVKYAPDGIYDSDVLVAFNSGHGLKLGTQTINYFGNAKGGSFYRLYQKQYGPLFPWDYDNHRSILYNPGVAAFIKNYLVEQAGPLTNSGLFSHWDGQAPLQELEEKTVHVCLKYIKGALDPLGYSDFYGKIQIGEHISPNTGVAKDKNELVVQQEDIQNKPCVWRWERNLTASIIPIKLDIFDKDSDEYTRPSFKDDQASLSKKPFQESLLFYVDLQNGLVYGDVEGKVQSKLTDKANFWAEGHSKSDNRVKIGFSIVVE
ncbi:MAG: carboxypeptidase-like regulatory domain-containing protein [Bacteroidota bacterium]